MNDLSIAALEIHHRITLLIDDSFCIGMKKERRRCFKRFRSWLRKHDVKIHNKAIDEVLKKISSTFCYYNASSYRDEIIKEIESLKREVENVE